MSVVIVFGIVLASLVAAVVYWLVGVVILTFVLTRYTDEFQPGNESDREIILILSIVWPLVLGLCVLFWIFQRLADLGHLISEHITAKGE